MVGRVDMVDSTLPALCFRSATFLKEKFFESRKEFTKCYNNWSASGQNEPDNFREYVGRLPNSELSAEGKRMIVMFTCTGQGTSNPDNRVTNMCSKVIPRNRGCDEGSPLHKDTNGFNVGDGSRANRGRLNSRSDDQVNTSIQSLTNVLIRREEYKLEQDRKRTKVSDDHVDDPEFRKISRQSYLVQEAQKASDALGHALKSQDTDSGKYILAELAHTQLESIKKALKAFLMKFNKVNTSTAVGNGLPCQMPGSADNAISPHMRDSASEDIDGLENVGNTAPHNRVRISDDEIHPNL